MFGFTFQLSFSRLKYCFRHENGEAINSSMWLAALQKLVSF